MRIKPSALWGVRRKISDGRTQNQYTRKIQMLGWHSLRGVCLNVSHLCQPRRWFCFYADPAPVPRPQCPKAGTRIPAFVRFRRRSGLPPVLQGLRDIVRRLSATEDMRIVWLLDKLASGCAPHIQAGVHSWFYGHRPVRVKPPSAPDIHRFLGGAFGRKAGISTVA